jgi:hypothetical protein
MKMTVSAKVVLLVAVPLICEVSCFAVLTSLTNQAEAQAAKDKHARELSDAVHDLAMDVFDARNKLKVSSVGILKMPQLVRMFQRKTREDIARIRTLAPGDARAQKVIDQTNQGLDESFAAVDSLTQSIQVSEADDLASLKEATKKRIEAAAQKILTPELSELARESAKQAGQEEAAALRRQARLALNCLLLGSVAITLALAIYSSKQITGRIERVSDNTRRFCQWPEASSGPRRFGRNC